MTIKRTIELVAGNGQCTGCGTCAGLCPQFAIQMVMDKQQRLYVPQRDKTKCNECGICFEVCPGHSVDFTLLNQETFGKLPEDSLMGNYLNCYTGYAVNYDIRYNSTSGGMITALLISALKQGSINGALVTRMNEKSPLEPEPFIATTVEEIISAAKSKYCPVPVNVALKYILEHDGKYAVVGLPCHIHGLRKAEAVNKKLRERIVLHLGIFCSHTDNFWMTGFALKKYKIKKEDVARIDYRGEGWPGAMTIQLKDDTKRLIPVDDYIAFHQFDFFSPPRCSLCYDQNAELADISCGDAWLPEIVARDKVGTSIVIARNESGKTLCEQARGKGLIKLETIDCKKVRGWAAPKKRRFKFRSSLLRLSGRPIPGYNVKLLKPGVIDYLIGSLFYFNAWFSSRTYLCRYIGTLVSAEQRSKQLLGKFRRVG